MDIYLVRAFTKDNRGGNPVGVVLEADNLSASEMQEIAQKVNFSETAFVQKSDKADFKVRFFTPTTEVDLCGHATIGVFSVLHQNMPAGAYTQETRAGILRVEIEPGGMVYMDQPIPNFLDYVESPVVASVLGIPTEWIDATELRPQLVSTGLKDILVPIDSRAHLMELSPDFERIAKLSKETNSVGIHAFTLDTIDPLATAHCRNFAPRFGINEESATGTSSGALACYLWRHNKVSKRDTMVFEQGYSMDMPSEISGKFDIDTDTTRIRIGGRVTIDKQCDVFELK